MQRFELDVTIVDETVDPCSVLVPFSPQASPFAKIFYAQSVKTLWWKIFVLSCTASSWITAVAVQELTQAGRGTPILIIVALVRKTCHEIKMYSLTVLSPVSICFEPQSCSCGGPGTGVIVSCSHNLERSAGHV